MIGQKIVLCNERFLARYGVDRILVLFASHLQAQGHEVSLSCLRSDSAALSAANLAVHDIQVPDGLDLIAQDIAASTVLLQYLLEKGKPDAVVIGGWPFFSLGEMARRHGIRTIFIDAGAVPHDGMPEMALQTQRELRRLRALYLRSIDQVLPISDFIRKSQTLPDRGTADGVETVLLGADHLAEVDESKLNPQESAIISQMEKDKGEGIAHVLLLGRFERYGYKNSTQAFEVLARLRRDIPGLRMLVLAGPDQVAVPHEMLDAVVLLPTVSDTCLSAVMRRSALGLSMSLWEGFNLPLAEMQWLERPALAYCVGAHPEVVADPWLLCASIEELSRKGSLLISEGELARARFADSFSRFRTRFRWEGTLDQWTNVVVAQPTEQQTSLPAPKRRLVLVDVTNAGRDPANSGVIRVTRRLSRELSKRSDLELVFVRWDRKSKSGAGGFRFLTHTNRRLLSTFGGPDDLLGAVLEHLVPDVESLLQAYGHYTQTQPILLVPEIALDGTATERMAWGVRVGASISILFYDMLPIYQPNYVDAAVQVGFVDYLNSLEHATCLWSISGFSQNELERYARDNLMQLPVAREAVLLPGQFSDLPRAIAQPEDGFDQTIDILCVSTIEPRKNHLTLLRAFDLLRRSEGGARLRLHLVGNTYVGAEKILAHVLEAAARDGQIIWHRVLTDAALADLYRKACFTVYPSLAEGYGLPIMESLWMARPCICHNDGVMAELAVGGGCIAVDMANTEILAGAMERLATDSGLRSSLREQAAVREIDTWENYADKIADRIIDI